MTIEAFTFQQTEWKLGTPNEQEEEEESFLENNNNDEH